MNTSTMRSAMVIAIGIGAMVVIGCTQKRLADRQRPIDPLPNRHWLHDARLRSTMAEMVQDHATLSNTVGDDAVDMHAWLSEVAETAGLLAESAHRIPDIVGGREMSEADRRAFNEQARYLVDQARSLQASAEQGRARDARDLLEEIDATCRSCHTRFRDYSGLIGPRQADAQESSRPTFQPQAARPSMSAPA